MTLAAFGVRRPVVANLVMLAIIGVGILFGLNLRREFFPETRANEVIVTAPYPGASPDEVEDAMVVKIEDRLADLENIVEINSTATEGAATIRIEFEDKVDINLAVADVKREVDALQDLPEQVERIIVEDFKPKLPVINLSLYGEEDERVRKDAIREIRNDLRSLPGLGEIVITGVRPDEIAVEVQQSAMLEHGLSLTEIASRVRQSMVELPGGAIRSATSNVSVRTLGADERVHEVRGIIVRSRPGGRAVRLEEVAEVTAGFADVDLRTRLNGEPSVTLVPFAPSDEDTIQIARTVRAYAAGRTGQPLEMTAAERNAWSNAQSGAAGDLPPRLAAYELGLSRTAPPPGELTLHNDLSRFITQRLNLLSRNALWGAGLVFLTLMLLLAPRVAFWVTIGLTVSILGTLAAMRFLDVSLNLLTMFGLIVVLGLLVDDAIVVAENITSRHEAGEPALAAAERGAEQVKWPVTATIITTICAFWPLRLIEGQIGDIIGSLPIVVAIALGVSLLESLLILPSHMAHDLLRAENRKPGRLRRLSERMDRARTILFEGVLIPRFLRILRPCLRARYLTLSVFTGVLIATLGLVAGGRVPFNFLSSSDSEFLIIDLQMPVGTPIERTDEVIRRIERVAMDMPEVSTVFTSVGARQDIDTSLETSQPHLGQLNLELLPGEDRDRSSETIKTAIRDQLGPIPGVKSLRFTEVGAGPSGPDITLTVVSENPERIGPVIQSLNHLLAEYEGVEGIADDADRGQRELRLRLREGATELGFTTEIVARQIRGAVFGLEAHTFPGQEEDVDVRVMLDEASRRSLSAIESMNIFAPTGQAVPLGEVVEIEEAESYATVRRLNRQRAITVTADVNRAISNPEQVTTALAPDLRRLTLENPSVRILPRGRQQEVRDSFASLPLGAAAAAGMIFVVLAWLFSSYTQPLVILLEVPFAVIGAIWGHWLLGYEITILSMIGFVALIGIVVNDSLILISFFNERRAEGLTVFDALVAAAGARLRAILLTTITTVLGLSPLMLEQSFQARILIPMAVTISFGLIASTLVTLIVLPCLLLVGADLRTLGSFLWNGAWPADAMDHVRNEETTEEALRRLTSERNNHV